MVIMRQGEARRMPECVPRVAAAQAAGRAWPGKFLPEATGKFRPTEPIIPRKSQRIAPRSLALELYSSLAQEL